MPLTIAASRQDSGISGIKGQKSGPQTSAGTGAWLYDPKGLKWNLIIFPQTRALYRIFDTLTHSLTHSHTHTADAAKGRWPQDLVYHSD